MLLIDFGLVVLIWSVQLIIYPSFLYYTDKDLVRWHQVYTTRVSYVVIPLMLGQLGLYIYHSIFDFNYVLLLNDLLILINWMLTFGSAVPLHGKIGRGEAVLESARKLVVMNWYRTFLWTLVFAISFFLL